jgi:predicted O-methyltransferase YrrM
MDNSLYPYLIEAILKIKDPAWLCDEIARDEDPAYVECDIFASLFGYVAKSDMDGKRVLDFGCGAGASTMIIARALPNSHIYGIELDERLLALAQLRAEYYHLDNLTLLRSPSSEQLPDQLPEFDFVLLSAVYEHMLPIERPLLLHQIWQRLAP